MFRSKIVLLALASAAFFAALALAYTSPGAPTGYVNDFAKVLSANDKAALESTLSNFHTSQGGDIAIAIIPSLNGDDIESYANTLFREWGVGTKDTNQGILIVVAIEDHKIRIEVGYGYEGVLPDIYASGIINDTITPRFKENDYAGGLTDGVNAVINYIENPNAEPPSQNQGFTFKDYEMFVYIFFFVLVWVGSILTRSKSWWGGGIVGAVIALVLGFVFSLTTGLISAVPLIAFGLFLDYIVSNAFANAKQNGTRPPWWGGGGIGGSFGGSSGGFGGFGGGSSGGGGASGGW